MTIFWLGREPVDGRHVVQHRLQFASKEVLAFHHRFLMFHSVWTLVIIHEDLMCVCGSVPCRPRAAAEITQPSP
jgi:hypothetical protein